MIIWDRNGKPAAFDAELYIYFWHLDTFTIFIINKFTIQKHTHIWTRRKIIMFRNVTPIFYEPNESKLKTTRMIK